jgi:acetylornithine aminotransferase
MIEPIQGEGGVHTASKEYLVALKQLCDQSNALLCFDEIQCGLGRTGKMWGHQHSGVLPDMLTSAKPLANGIPIGAVIMNERVSQVMNAGDHGTTFGGNPLACTVACEVVGRIEELLDHVTEQGSQFKQALIGLHEAYPRLIKEIRGSGFILGMEMSKAGDQDKLVELCRSNGLLMVTAGSNSVRILPPLIATSENLSDCITLIDKSLRTLHESSNE